MDDGWVKIYRKIDEWGWYKDSKTLHLFIHLLIHANHKPRIWQGMTVERGQLVTGLFALKSATGISIRSIRTCLTRLEQTKEITLKSTNRFTVVTLCNYSEYQAENITNDKQTTNKRQTNDNEQECKNVRIEDKDLKTLALKEKNNTNNAFETFWQTYPKKKSKGQAKKVWDKIRPHVELQTRIAVALAQAKTSPDWKKEDGKYIPYPATWLNAEGWEDELPPDPDTCHICKRHITIPGIGFLTQTAQGMICKTCKKGDNE